MPSIQQSAKGHLQRMVEGAGQRAGRKGKGQGVRAGLTPDLRQKLEEQMARHGKTLQNIPIHWIQVDENVRQRCDASRLQQLASSLKQDGLIQFPTLCLKVLKDGRGVFVCRNGHRRIMAAQSLGWQSMECVIVPFESERDALYHTLNANISEDVFYLDLAVAYQYAHELGESDATIAERVGLNPRTVAWYRRLASMSEICQNLCRDHSGLFNATWAIKLARQGQLPKGPELEAMMRQMIKAGKTWLNDGEPKPVAEHSKELVHVQKKRQLAQQKLKTWLHERSQKGQQKFAKQLLDGLVEAGYLSQSSWQRIEKTFFLPPEPVDFVNRGLRSRQGKSAVRVKKAKA